jgi:hypothetical protein
MMVGPEIRVWVIEKVDNGSRFVKRPCCPFLAPGIVDRNYLSGFPPVLSLQVFAG